MPLCFLSGSALEGICLRDSLNCFAFLTWLNLKHKSSQGIYTYYLPSHCNLETELLHANTGDLFIYVVYQYHSWTSMQLALILSTYIAIIWYVVLFVTCFHFVFCLLFYFKVYVGSEKLEIKTANGKMTYVDMHCLLGNVPMLIIRHDHILSRTVLMCREHAWTHLVMDDEP